MFRNGNIDFDESAFVDDSYFFILEHSRIINFRLERNERLSACLEGFLYSARTYRNHYGDFKVYAKECMNEHMKIRRKELSKQKQSEKYNFSLDKTVFNDNDKTTYADIICVDNFDYFKNLEFKESISKMNTESQRICILLAQGYKNKEICNILNLTAAEFESHKLIIKQELLKYKERNNL